MIYLIGNKKLAPDMTTPTIVVAEKLP